MTIYIPQESEPTNYAVMAVGCVDYWPDLFDEFLEMAREAGEFDSWYDLGGEQ